MPWCGHVPLRDDCHRCNLVRTDGRYRRLWGIDAEKLRPCKHLGRATGETVPTGCGSCPTSTGEPVYACGVFGECTTAKQLQQLPCCLNCTHKEI